jgi:inhibitor of cysteine peptidase
MIKADESFNGREVVIQPGETLEVSLAENASTGYRWVISEDSKNKFGKTIHEREQSVEAPAPPAPPGKPGIRHLYFEAAEPGAVELEIHYRRPWETGKPPARTFRLRILVQPAPAR